MLIFKGGSSLLSASTDNNNIQENGHLELVANPPNFPNHSNCMPNVLGSCNGLLCFSFPNCCLLWNPSTRTHHVLTNDLTNDKRLKSGKYYFFHGLGYDEVHDDYKLMRVVQFIGRMSDGNHDDWNLLDNEFWVYSLNSYSWKMVAEAKWCLPFGFTDVFVNGSLHFRVKKSREWLIVAFDVSNDTYRFITKPACVDQDREFDLGVLDGCLSMVQKGKTEVGTFRVLQMREYGNGLSWTEQFRFEMNGGPGFMRPITYVMKQNKKQVLFLGGAKLFCFDVESDSIKDVQITGMDCGNISEVCVCTESQRILHTDDDSIGRVDSRYL